MKRDDVNLMVSSSNSENNPYQQAWELYKVQEKRAKLATWGYIPSVAIFWFVTKKIYDSELIIGIVSVICFVTVIILDRKVAGFKCPRCGKYYYSKVLLFNGFAKKCLNCGLKKWSNNDAN